MNIIPINENTLSCVFDEAIDPAVNQQAVRLMAAIKEANISGISEMVVSYNTLVIYFDDRRTSHDVLTDAINALKVSDAMKREPKTYVIPVCYEAPYALDLKELADYSGLTEEEVVTRHTAQPYLIYMLGFMPGFPYLGGLDESIAMPRRKNPRQRIEAGSVGIAGSQTGMYPLDSPGGWNIIGRTPLTLFDANRTPEVYYEAGDYIQFKAITAAEFDEIKKEIAAGTYDVLVLEGN